MADEVDTALHYQHTWVCRDEDDSVEYLNYLLACLKREIGPLCNINDHDDLMDILHVIELKTGIDYASRNNEDIDLWNQHRSDFTSYGVG